MRNKTLTVYIMFVVLLLSSFISYPVLSDVIERDYWPTNGWQKASFEDVGMNEQTIDRMFEYIDENNFNIDSVLIVKDGYLVVEEYLSYYTAGILHPVYSVTKSFISTLIGITIEEGVIESVNQKILDFFVNVSVPNIELRENVTIYHLLTMTSGISWREDISYYLPENSFVQMKASDNWVEFVLSRGKDEEPGTVFNYNSGGSHLLSAIIEEATGNSTFEYANEHIFEPVGFTDVFWSQDPQGIYFGGADLHLLPRDMAKFGFLFLNNGTWNETQIVSKEWVDQASNNTVVVSGWSWYGYQWWVYPQMNAYLALGWAGQIIQVMPDYDMVVVFTSSLAEFDWPFVYLTIDYIIKSVEEGYSSPTEASTESFVIAISIVMLVGWIKRKRKL